MRFSTRQRSHVRRAALSPFLTAVLFLVGNGVASGQTITYVQSTYVVPQTPQSIVTVRYPGAQTLGALNVVVIGWNDAVSHVVSVTDASGNSYSPALAPTVQAGIQSQAIYFAANIAAASANANLVTVTFDRAVDFPDVRIAEYRGLATTNVVDVAVGSSGTGGTSNSGSIQTTNANDLLIGANYVQSVTTAGGSGYTTRLITNPDGNILEDRIVTATGTYTATATVNGSMGWVMQLVAFRGAGGSSDTQAPTAPANLTATATSATQVNLTWTASTDNVGVTNYLIERCQGAGCSNFAQIATSTATAYSNTPLSASTSYSYRVRATDAAGNLSAYSSIATAVTPAATDTQAPTTPTSLTATAISTSEIDLTWAASTDNVGVTNYLIERCQGAGCSNFAQVATSTTTSFNNTGLAASTSFSYRVRATDAAGNLSAYSAVSGATTLTPTDSQPPTPPGNMTATAVSSSQINLTWTASTDNVGVTNYLIERCQSAGCSNFAQVATSASTSYSNTGLAAATSYSYRIRATDAAGNLSSYSTTVSTTTQASTSTIAFVQAAYAVPQTSQSSVTVRYNAAQISGDLNVIAIGWSNSVSQVVSVVDTVGNSYVAALGTTVQAGVQSHVIYYAANIAPAAASANQVTVTFNQAVSFPDVRIAEYRGIATANVVDAAIGASGTGGTSNSGTIVTTNANDLLVAGNLVQTSTTAAGTGYTSRVITTPNGDLLEDRIVTATGSYNATASLSGSNGWVMQLVAFKGAGSQPPDTQPPTAPANLTAAAVASSQINLTWTASSDNVGVTGYLIERCKNASCSNFAQISTSTAPSYNDVGLSGSTAYTYRVRATDSQNYSDYSNSASATTPQAPALTVFMATPSSGSTLSGSVSLRATPSNNGIGVQFQVDGVNVGPAAGSPFSTLFDTSQFKNGSHSITAYTWDNQQNVAYAVPVSVTFSNATPGDPATTGLWSGLFSWPLVSVHLNLLRDGRVLAWDKFDTGNQVPQVWDPLTSAFTPVPVNDNSNLFCAASTTLPDGRLVSVGGHITDHVGLAAVKIFDPATNLWSSAPDLTYGRWYPTATTLPNGRVLVLSGEVNCKGCGADIPEVYDPRTNTMTTLPVASLSMPFYPHAYVLPDGRILVAATTESPTPTRVLNLATQSWSTVDTRKLDAYSSAMYLPGKFIKSGTSTDSESTKTSAATSYVLDMSASNPRWQNAGSMAYARAYHVLTVLPDGSVLATGGGKTTGDYDTANAVYAAEVWSPATQKWTTLASMHTWRLYHGTAILLPDARVLVSGSGRSPGPDTRDRENAEIFAPPYLFKGPRPTITGAPTQGTLNSTFTVQTPDASRIATVALVAIGNMTHGINMNQRYLPLSFTAGAGSLTVTAPANANLAPPGVYMLFLVDNLGVPSIASIMSF